MMAKDILSGAIDAGEGKEGSTSTAPWRFAQCDEWRAATQQGHDSAQDSAEMSMSCAANRCTRFEAQRMLLQAEVRGGEALAACG
jgi:hypothetical protein